MSIIIRNDTENSIVTVEVRIQKIYMSKPVQVEHVYLLDMKEDIDKIEEKTTFIIKDMNKN